MPRRHRLRSILALLVTVAAACSSGGDGAAPATTEPRTTTTEAPPTTEPPATTTTTERPAEWPPELVPSTDPARAVPDPLVTVHHTAAVTEDEVAEVTDLVLAARDVLGMTGAFRQDVFVHRDEPYEYADEYLAIGYFPPEMTVDDVADHLTHANPAIGNRDGTHAATFVNARIAFGDPRSHKHGGIVAAHEAIHGVTDFLAGGGIPPGPDGVPGGGPLWLTEGFADHRAYEVTYRTGRMVGGMDAGSLRDRVVGIASGAAPLEGMATDDGFLSTPTDVAYGTSQLAAELVERYAGRLAIDRTYWEAIPRVGWRQAFEQSFGMTVEDFYGRFAAWQELGFPA